MVALIECKKISNEIKENIRRELDNNSNTSKPGLALLSFEQEGTIDFFFKNIIKECEQVNFEVLHKNFYPQVVQSQVNEFISWCNQHNEIDAIVIGRPLPLSINIDSISKTIHATKDVDGITQFNHGIHNIEHYHPCVVSAVMTILDAVVDSLESLHVTIINDSDSIGKPLSMRLLQQGCTVTSCNKYTRDLLRHTKLSDIIITATGQPKIITGDMLKEGCVVIDVGTSLVNGMVVGDVDIESVSSVASAITPVPKGVGAVTLAYVLKNTFDAWKKRVPE